MKSIAFLSILCAFSSSSSALTLQEAYNHVHAELGLVLSAMTLEWEYYGYYDEVSCFFIQDLASHWPAAFASVYADPDYVVLRNEFTAAGVAWDAFMTDEVEGATGHLPYLRYPFHICTMSEHGGIDAMREAVKNWLDSRRAAVTAAVDYARSNSAEYAAIYNRVSVNTQGAHNLRCSAEMQSVYTRMGEYQFELNFFFDIFGIMFGMPVPANC
jgi:hypothetical protein